MIPNKKVSVIIPAQNEESTIGRVLQEIGKLRPDETIVVVNGSTDQTAAIAKQHGARVIHYSQSLGNDIGRAIGAYYAHGDILLFTDADIPIPADQLRLFIETIRRGYDLALNDLSWSASLPIIPHPTTVAKLAINHMLRKPSYSVNSLLAIPHALSRKTVEYIHWSTLADPILAQALAVHHNLRFSFPARIDVLRNNKPRDSHQLTSTKQVLPESTSRILGDHLRAIYYLTSVKGPRGGFTDGQRKRSFLELYPAPVKRRRAKRSAIIPVAEERDSLEQVLQSVLQVGVDELIVVANGADEETKQIARRYSTQLISFSKRLGHNVGRAIGAAHASGDLLLFVDGDFPIDSQDLLPFIQRVESNQVDIALNDLTPLLRQYAPIDAVSLFKYFLNLALLRPDLYNNSLTAIPHALSRRVVEAIGFKNLMIPPLAQVMAIRKGFRVEGVHYVDVVKPNRIRKEHLLRNGRIEAFDRIFGDHLEALHYLLQQTNIRGGFSDGSRRRELVRELRRGLADE